MQAGNILMHGDLLRQSGEPTKTRKAMVVGHKELNFITVVPIGFSVPARQYVNEIDLVDCSIIDSCGNVILFIATIGTGAFKPYCYYGDVSPKLLLPLLSFYGDYV